MGRLLHDRDSPLLSVGMALASLLPGPSPRLIPLLRAD